MGWVFSRKIANWPHINLNEPVITQEQFRRQNPEFRSGKTEGHPPKASPSAMRLPAPLLLGFLSVIYGYGVLMQGGAATSDWTVCVLGLGILALLVGLSSPRGCSAPPLEPWLWWPVLLILCYGVLQLVPVPMSWLKVLSPAREKLADALRPLIPGVGFATVSVMPSETLPILLQIGGCIVVFLAVREILWHSPNKPWIATLPILLVAGLEALLGLVQYRMGGPGSFAQGTYGNRDHFAASLEMVLPFAVIYPVAVFRQERLRRYLSPIAVVKACAMLSLAALILLGIIYSLSRMGFVTALGSLFLMGALGLGAAVSVRKKWVAVCLVGGLTLLGFIFLPPDQLIKRFAQLSSTEKITAEGRLLMWKETLPLIAAYPLFGCGLGGYESAFLKFNVTSPNSTVDYAHNDYLQFLAELGVVGFSILAVLMLTLLVKASQVALQHPRVGSRFLGLACSGAMTAIGLHSFADFNLYIPANALLLAWISGIAAGIAESRGARSWGLGRENQSHEGCHRRERLDPRENWTQMNAEKADLETGQD